MSSVYIHIPFCRSRCIYCDFYSTTLGEDVMSAYVRALEHEMCLRKQEAHLARVHSLYIGGGTPSLLPQDRLTELFTAVGRHFVLHADAEVTIEANPDDVTPHWLESLSHTPVNRISMGAQTFSDRLLTLLRRRHNARQTVSAVQACKDAGIRNISLDLIYGLPGQTMDDWQSDVEQALALGIKHLSAYSLSVEPGTPLDSSPYKRELEGGRYEELSRRMYDHLIDATKQAGFLHYEISNFARPGFHSRHNSIYWQGKPYLGLGAGAHSYDGLSTRRANLPDIKAYIDAKGDAPHETEVLGNDELYDEFIMTRLRTSDGIPLDKLSDDDRRYCLGQATPYLARHLLKVHNEHLSLTQEGIFTSNSIICDLMK